MEFRSQAGRLCQPHVRREELLSPGKMCLALAVTVSATYCCVCQIQSLRCEEQAPQQRRTASSRAVAVCLACNLLSSESGRGGAGPPAAAAGVNALATNASRAPRRMVPCAMVSSSCGFAVPERASAGSAASLPARQGAAVGHLWPHLPPRTGGSVPSRGHLTPPPAVAPVCSRTHLIACALAGTLEPCPRLRLSLKAGERSRKGRRRREQQRRERSSREGRGRREQQKRDRQKGAAEEGEAEGSSRKGTGARGGALDSSLWMVRGEGGRADEGRDSPAVSTCTRCSALPAADCCCPGCTQRATLGAQCQGSMGQERTV